MIKSDLNNVINYTKTQIDDILPENYLKLFLFNGSKYIRSRIGLLYILANGEKISDNLYKILSAGELIHNASLLQDDVIDSSDSRRGITTVGVKFSPKISILAGDYLVSKAVDILSELKDSYIINVFNSAIQEMSKAEINQFFNRNKKITEKEYIKICSCKTGVLFSAILQTSAYIFGLSEENAKKFGTLFGIIFQMNNDLNIESIKNDKLNGICTIVDIMGVEKANVLLDNYKQELLGLLNDFSDNQYKRELKDLIENL